MSKGYADVVVGMQYGDEGKARIIDKIAQNYDVVARFNGGSNAGHTVKVGDETVALQQVPSGLFYPDKILYVGSGCVINVLKLAAELEKIAAIGIDLKGRLHISSQASVVQPHHLLIDAMIGGTVGTTKNGIGPVYADKALRMWGDRLLNIRLGDLLDNREYYFGMLEKNLSEAVKIYGLEAGEAADLPEKMKQAFEAVAGYVEKDTLFMERMVEKGARVIFEGAQSYMLDVTRGSVPYVTSSSTIAGAAYVGGDLSPQYHRQTMGIGKALMSRVGHGPFVSEFGGAKSEEYCMLAAEDGGPKYGRAVEAQYDLEALIKSEDPFEMAKALRILSGEYGTVTTRPRRVGALDLVQLRHAVRVNGVKGLYLNKCDLLNVFSRTKDGRIPLVTGYELDGEKIDYIPGATGAYGRVKAIIEYFDGFSEDVSEVRVAADLPANLRAVLKRVEEFAGCEIYGVGVGPEREQFVEMKKIG